MLRHARPLILLSLVAALPACVNSNARSTIGRDLTLPAFTDAGAGPVSEPKPSAPSLNGMDRSHWATQTVLVPIDGPEHRSLYATQLTTSNKTARQRLEYPTPLSALETSRDSHATQLGHAAAGAGYAAWDVLAMLPRMAMNAPWSGPDRGTPYPYWRAPVTEARTSTNADPAAAYDRAPEPAEAKPADPAAAYDRRAPK